jgi:PAS domain S-box-containing protein
MKGLSLLTAMASIGMVCFLICIFYLALFKAHRSERTTKTYTFLAITYACQGLQHVCAILAMHGVPFMGQAVEFLYVIWIFTFWVGVRAYGGKTTFNPVWLIVPALLIAWNLVGHGLATSRFWGLLPEHFTGAAFLCWAGLHLWRLNRERWNWGLTVLAILFLLYGLNTAIFPFTNHTWYGPYGFIVASDLSLAIGMGVMLTALLEEQGELVSEMKGRKLAEEALESERTLLRNLIDNIPDRIYAKDTESRFIICNEALVRRMGKTRMTEIVGKTDFDLLPLEMAQRFYADEQTIIQTGIPIINCEEPLTIEGGKITRWNLASKVPLLDRYGNRIGIVGIGREITDLKQVEEKLRESEAKFQELFDGAPVGYHELNAEGRIVRVNRTELEMLRYTFEQMIGQPVWEFVVERETSRQAVLDKLADKIAPAQSYERIYRRRDGSTVTFLIEDRILRDGNGRITGIRSTIQDITERKQAEETLQTSEEQANQLARENAIMAEIGRIISSTLNIDEVYDRFAGEVRKLIPFDRITISIINPEEKTATVAYGTGSVVSGRQPGDVFPLAGTVVEETMRIHSGLVVQTDNVSDLAGRFPGLLPHFQAGQRSMLSIPLISKDRVIGNLFLGSARLNAYTNRDLRLAESIASQIAGAIANAQLFIERQRLEERLNRAEKMEALGTLAGGVAHDLNNVLGVLVGYSELLLLEIKEGSPLRRHVSNILQSGQRAAAIIQDLLTLARRGVAVSEVVNLNPVISDYFKTPEFEKLKAYHPRVTFRTNLDKDLMNIKGSSIHLSKTIMNLLSNAAEAISDRGEVTILTENRYFDKPFAGYDHIQEGDYVVLRVSDNGKGISKGDLGKIFEPFYTKKAMGRSGTGLGLAIVWGTVKDHG